MILGVATMLDQSLSFLAGNLYEVRPAFYGEYECGSFFVIRENEKCSQNQPLYIFCIMLL